VVKRPMDFILKAQNWWNDERTQKLTAGKKYLVLPAKAPELLRVMGLLNADATMSADNVRKYQQVNHLLQLIEPQLKDLAERHARVEVLDACCGSSFIALTAAWLLRQWGKPCRVLGIDRNPAVIAKSRARAEMLGWGDFVKFAEHSVDKNVWNVAYQEQFQEEAPKRPHMLCALHACDTATDHALAVGIGTGADYMAVAPCCQAELARQWDAVRADSNNPFLPIFQSPNLRRDIAASMTDALRMLLVRAHGYEVTATEFVPSAHTPKNRLLVCTRRGKFHREAQVQYQLLKESLAKATITLEGLLTEGSPQ